MMRPRAESASLVALALASLGSWTLAAHAHARGTSTLDFALEANGDVQAVFVGSSAEILLATGQAPSAEARGDDTLRALDPALRSFFVDGMALRADDHACVGAFQSARFVEGDGLRLEARFVCGDVTRSLTASVAFFSTLAPGHRTIGRIVAGDLVTDAMLSSSRRMFGLELPPPKARPARGSRVLYSAIALAGLVVGLLFGLRWRRRRTSRARDD